MPQISKAELDSVKKKQGIYSKLRFNAEETNDFISTLKLQVMKLAEKSFRAYAKAHKGCSKELEDREWTRFKRFLEKNL